MKSKNVIILILFLISVSGTFAQNLNLDGIISGYNYNPSKGLFKKGNQVLLEGRLNDALIVISDKTVIVNSTKSNNKGQFHIEIPEGKLYSVKISKKNYASIAFKLDLTKAPKDEDINFTLLELILNSHISKKSKLTEFGEIEFKSDRFTFNEFDQKSSLFKQKVDYTPLISLITKSISNNKSKIYTDKQAVSNKKSTSSSSQTDEEFIITDSTEVINVEKYKSVVYTNLLNEDLDISDKESLIEKAKKQLELDKINASTPLDYLLIEERGKLIVAAENELLHLKEIISQKENEISLKNNQLILFIVASVLLLIMLYFILRASKIKSKLNKELESKNKKIIDSINYAVKIQDAILPVTTGLTKHLDSFILFKPKDKVSGDFYWFEEVGDNIIVAAVDCTGHGVPGAFMSMIGNVLMNTIILESKITSPKEILETLNTELKSALNQDNSDPFSSQDGMDMSICVVNKKNKTVTYAGAMNPLFLLKDGEIETLEVTKKGVGGFDFFKGKPFTENTIKLEAGSQLYMLSDGYMDQFGGESGEKYNLTRFKTLLSECDSKPMKTQQEIFDKSLTDWKGTHDQTDDVLVIGINL